MESGGVLDQRLGRRLVLDELFDLSLYTALHARSEGQLRSTLSSLMSIEKRHFDFWQEAFRVRAQRLDLPRKIKLWVLLLGCRLFGEGAIHLTLEAIEVHGIQKYLALWDQYQDLPLGQAIRRVLEDEFQHEERVVSELVERQVRPERIRNVLLGLNDGLVEMLGAVSGFFAAFQSVPLVLVAAASVAVAGALSMGAGAFAASSSEGEVSEIERRKRQFLGEPDGDTGSRERAATTAAFVGVSYVVGALVPVLPLLLGATNMWASVLAAIFAVVTVSAVLSFLSGMDLGRRVGLNLLIASLSVAASYGIGTLAKTFWGVSV